MEPVKRGQKRQCCDSFSDVPHAAGCKMRVKNNQPTSGYSLLEWDYTWDEVGNLIRSADGRPVMRLRTKAEVKALKTQKETAERDSGKMEIQLRKSNGMINGRRVA